MRPSPSNAAGQTLRTPTLAQPNRAPGRGTRDLTEGSLTSHLLALAVPSALTNLLNFSYTFINMMWLGRLGPSAMAVTITWQYFFMIFVFFNQIVGLGSITLIARTFGAKQYGECRRFIGQTFSFKLVVAIIVMVLGLAFQRWAWIKFGSRPEVVEQGVRYGTVLLCVIPIFFSAFTLRSSLTAIGDMRTLLRISIISTITNVVLDPFFIFDHVYIGPFPQLGLDRPLLVLPGAGLGVPGAAWASSIAFFVLFILGQYYFMSGKTFIRVGFRDFFSWNWTTVKRILSVGTPPALAENLSSFANLMIGKWVNLYGTEVFAAQGVVGTLIGLVMIPVSGLGQSVMAIVGQNLGAGNPKRAERCVYLAVGMTAGILILGVAAAALWTSPLIRLFLPQHDESSLLTIHWASMFLRVSLFFLLFAGIAGVMSAAFWGSGYTRPAMWITLGTTWGVQLPMVFICAVWLKLANPVFIPWAAVVAQLFGAIAIFLVFRMGRWKTVKV